MTSYAGRFAGKVAVVTGGAQGIGRTVALRIAREGGSLALVDRSPLVEEVRHEAEAAGAEAIAIIADLETFSGATAAIRGARERFGGIDILVNNVGGTIWAKPYAEYAEAQIEAEIRRSLFPTLWCCRAALPGMLARDAGVIVNVSSIATRGVNRVPYAARAESAVELKRVAEHHCQLLAFGLGLRRDIVGCCGHGDIGQDELRAS